MDQRPIDLVSVLINYGDGPADVFEVHNSNRE
jgi:hypothetical protein